MYLVEYATPGQTKGNSWGIEHSRPRYKFSDIRVIREFKIDTSIHTFFTLDQLIAKAIAGELEQL